LQQPPEPDPAANIQERSRTEATGAIADAIPNATSTNAESAPPSEQRTAALEANSTSPPIDGGSSSVRLDYQKAPFFAYDYPDDFPASGQSAIETARQQANRQFESSGASTFEEFIGVRVEWFWQLVTVAASIIGEVESKEWSVKRRRAILDDYSLKAAEAVGIPSRRFEKLIESERWRALDDRLLARINSPGATEGAANAAPERRFEKTGDVWSLQFEGTSVLVVHRIGMAYIEHLLRSPNHPLSCMKLQAAVGGNPDGRTVLDKQDEAELPAASFVGNEILDEPARKQYRERLASIEDELQQAERNNDMGQRERLTEEKQWLIEELKSKIGLAGRPRRFATDAEKARKAVSGAIVASLKMIGKQHPELAKHLDDRIDRGAHCCYRGDGIDWKV